MTKAYRDLLVGSTGFVGQNLMASHDFAAVCHSTDVAEYYGSEPELCLYCGVPAAMYLANAQPEADLQLMAQARENLRRIAPKKVVLVSSIAVYADSRGKDERAEMDDDGLPAYGQNRLQLEKWVREDFPDALIVRLPALYGRALKKNFLFDLHTITPAMLRADKYAQLREKSALIGSAYVDMGNGYYKLAADAPRAALRAFFAGNDFNALAFTDSRSRYQFYNLGRLWQDIANALAANLKLFNITTPPVSAAQVYAAVTGRDDWRNELNKEPFDYDLRSCHAESFGGRDGYLISEEEEIKDICRFMQAWTDGERL